MKKHEPFPTLIDPDDSTLPVLKQDEVFVDHLAIVNASFPRIAEAIKLLWGTPELHNYMTKLIVDDRHYETGTSRQGFPKDVMASLLAIFNKHSAGAPITDIWHESR